MYGSSPSSGGPGGAGAPAFALALGTLAGGLVCESDCESSLDAEAELAAGWTGARSLLFCSSCFTLVLAIFASEHGRSFVGLPLFGSSPSPPPPGGALALYVALLCARVFQLDGAGSVLCSCLGGGLAELLRLEVGEVAIGIGGVGGLSDFFRLKLSARIFSRSSGVRELTSCLKFS